MTQLGKAMMETKEQKEQKLGRSMADEWVSLLSEDRVKKIIAEHNKKLLRGMK